MKKDFITYKPIDHLKYIKVIFLSFLFVFLANYMSNIYTSYIDYKIDSHELVKDFETENSEESEKSERETEFEDLDELYFLSYTKLNFDIHFKKVHNPCTLFETSNSEEVDTPPPIC